MRSNRAFVVFLLVFVLVIATIGVWIGGLETLDPSAAADDPRDFRFEGGVGHAGIDYASSASRSGTGLNGFYVTDFDNDFHPDLLATGGERPVVYRNVDDGFEQADVLPPVNSTVVGALFFDYDNDGWEDLLLLALHDEPVFLKNVGGRYRIRNVGFDAELDVPIAAAAADVGADGRPDVFVAQYGDWAEHAPMGYRNFTRHRDDNGNPNYLFRWNGSAYVRAEGAGIKGERWSMAASFVDLTGDGRPDIHVANDFNNDTVYLNRGDGTFEQRLLSEATNRNGMASEVADVNGDGRPDVFTTNVFLPISRANITEREYRLLFEADHFLLGDRIEGNTLLINRGNGRFTDRAASYGVRKGGWGWAAAFVDFDNDGDKDLLHTTQLFVRTNKTDPFYTYPMLWRRTDDGFEQVIASDAGFAETDGRGAAVLDFDDDGQQDLAIAVYDGRYAAYTNRIDAGHSLQVLVKSGRLNRTSLGARVSVTAGGATQVDVKSSKADYQSQDTRTLHFGLGERNTATVRVIWPDGTEIRIEGVVADQRILITPDGIQRRIDLAK